MKPIIVTGRRLTLNETCKRLNAHLLVGGLEDPKRERHERREVQDPPLERRAARVAWRVTIVSLRRKLVDQHDNLRTGAKPLVDAIAASIGRSDDKIEWEYQQFRTDGRTGTMIKIERVLTEFVPAA